MAAPLLQHYELTVFFCRDPCWRGADRGGMWRQGGVTTFINGADRQFRLKRCAEFVHQYHIQLAPQFLCQCEAHRHSPPRDRQNEWRLSAVAQQPLGQQMACLHSVLEHEGFLVFKAHSVQQSRSCWCSAP